MEHYNVSKPVSNFVPKLQQSNLGHSSEGNMCDDHNTQMAGNRKVIFRSTLMGYLFMFYGLCSHVLIYMLQMVCLEATLVGALRREKLAETAARRLDAEIEQMNRLVCLAITKAWFCFNFIQET